MKLMITLNQINNKSLKRNLRMKCPFDCVFCALKGFAIIEPPAEKLQGTEGIFVANFICPCAGNVSIHPFPKDKLEELLEMREKILKNLETINN